jgi:RecA-family ATPase
MIPRRGASLINGASKSGKTLFGAQAAIAVASNTALFDQYQVLVSGPVLMIEQDDPAATASVKDILTRSPLPVADIPFYLVPKVPFNFGPELIAWLEAEIVGRSVRLVVLDSYTALRGSRPKGGDIVKAEQGDLTELDALAKRTDCAIAIIHHASKGSAALDWSQQAAGSFAMSAATESQIFVSRFAELEGAAPERLIRIRGRHSEDLEMVLRFRKETLDYEYVLEGGAAPLYPLILQIRTAFGTQSFGPKELCHATGVSRATAHRQIDRLFRAGALSKRGFGDYVLDGVRQ